MPTQKLRPTANEKIVIVTPAGLIEMVFEGNKHWAIKTPRGMVAFKNRERALSRSQWVCEDECGRIVPRYRWLVPDLDETGELCGVREPDEATPLRLKMEKMNGTWNSRRLANVVHLA